MGDPIIRSKLRPAGRIKQSDVSEVQMRGISLTLTENEFDNLLKMKQLAIKRQNKYLSWEKFIFQEVMRLKK